MDSLKLINLPLKGGVFTWFGSKNPPQASRLDRFCISSDLLLFWPNLIQNVLPKSISDHCPISLENNETFMGNKPFKWFLSWSEMEGYSNIIKEAVSTSESKGVSKVLTECKSRSKSWLRKVGKVNTDEIKELEVNLQNLEDKIYNANSQLNLIQEAEEKRSILWRLYRREELEWLQKSRIRWFREGDRNTRFFHLSASIRRSKNQISCIKFGDDTFCEQDSILELFEQHFRNFYSNRIALNIRRWTTPLNSISKEVADWLERPFSLDEIWEAVDTADGNKAPGPDGFNLEFFKKYWGILKNSVMNFFEDFHAGKGIPPELNATFITLIPKVKSPETINDYRPISLVGSLYKILARVLARRLAPHMNELVSEQQFAFIKGRQITDCSLVANEIVDLAKKRGDKIVIFKADFKKAYDSIEWPFLFLVLKKMGFGPKWCKWIRSCVTTATLSILVNGSPSRFFRIKKGLRQGCPLSPFLFNLVAEGLSATLSKAVNLGLFKGIDVTNNNLSISHLQFADDLILFSEAKLEQTQNIKRILRVFEVASGLQLNLKKTELFGINVDNDTLHQYAATIKCSCSLLPTKYLGLPLGVSKNCVSIWNPVLEKFRSHLSGWKEATLSPAGRLTLVKSVLYNLPIYFMTLFKMPVSISMQLNSLISKFIWGKVDGRAIHWVRWEDICCPREVGGLGIVDTKIRNRGLLNKWIWKFSSDREGLWRKVIDAKYYESSNSLLPSNVNQKKLSWMWRDITKPLYFQSDLFTENLRPILGDGKLIDFWFDCWAGIIPLAYQFPRIFALAVKKKGKVNEFGSKNQYGWVWQIDIRRQLFDWELGLWEQFLQTIIMYSGNLFPTDSLRWVGDSSGWYTPKKFCYLSSTVDKAKDELWKLVWDKYIPPKAQFFMWRLMRGRLSTKANLIKRGTNLISEDRCPVCGVDEETEHRLFFACSVSWRCWMKWCSKWGVLFTFPGSPPCVLAAWNECNVSKDSRTVWVISFFAFCWSFWMHRNEVVFKSRRQSDDQLFAGAQIRTFQWCQNNWPETFTSESHFLANPSGSECSLAKHSKLLSECAFLAEAEFTFFVDGAVKGSFGDAGIGGLVKDSSGKQQVKFSKSAGNIDATSAELLAIKEACLLCKTIPRFAGKKILFVSDSSLAISWIQDFGSSPPTFKPLVDEIRNAALTCKWKFEYISREENSEADLLAKMGIKRASALVWVLEA